MRFFCVILFLSYEGNIRKLTFFFFTKTLSNPWIRKSSLFAFSGALSCGITRPIFFFIVNQKKEQNSKVSIRTEKPKEQIPRSDLLHGTRIARCHSITDVKFVEIIIRVWQIQRSLSFPEGPNSWLHKLSEILTISLIAKKKVKKEKEKLSEISHDTALDLSWLNKVNTNYWLTCRAHRAYQFDFLITWSFAE